eukprot:529414-Pelagomonas_calceolata.AAC.1
MLDHMHAHTFNATLARRLKTLPGVSDSTLRLVRDAENGIDILHRHPLGDSPTTNANVVGLNAKIATISGYFDASGVADSEERGSVHIIDMVMLPIPED